MDPDRCHLAGVDFLGSMEVDLWGIYAKIARKMREEVERVEKMACGGKMIGRAGIYRVEIIRRGEWLFAAAKSVYAAA